MNFPDIHTYLPYLPIVLYGFFFVIASGLLLYNLLYQREIHKSKEQIGLTVPIKVTEFLKIGFYLGCVTLILLSIFLIREVFVLAERL